MKAEDASSRWAPWRRPLTPYHVHHLRYLHRFCVSDTYFPGLERTAARAENRRSMPPVLHALPAHQRRSVLLREITAILVFKLLALIALYFLFFDERPDIQPSSVEQRVLEQRVENP
jgi:hypothetical protein